MPLQFLFRQITGNIPAEKFWVGFVAKFMQTQDARSVPGYHAIEVTSLGLSVAEDKRSKNGFSFPIDLRSRNRADKQVVQRLYVGIDDPNLVFTEFPFLESVDFVFAAKGGATLSELDGACSVTVFDRAHSDGVVMDISGAHAGKRAVRLPVILAKDGSRSFELGAELSAIDDYPGDIDGYCEQQINRLKSAKPTLPEALPRELLNPGNEEPHKRLELSVTPKPEPKPDPKPDPWFKNVRLLIALGVGVAAMYIAQGYFFKPKQLEQASPPITSRPPVAESKPNDSASGAVAIDPNIVTKGALNQLLQLATENDWNGVDAMVRSLKGVSHDGGNRKEARALNKSALELMAKNEFAAAVVELEKAALADHKDIEIRNNLGYAKLRVGNIDAAVFDLLEALLIDPTRAAAWLNVSEAFAEKEKVAAADASLKLAFHFSRDQSKALAFLKGDQSQFPSEKFRATIQRTESVLATIPQYTR